ncbi:EAL domain-containing protein [Nitratidesulfovibrio sp. HK-II]|uniref:EAL domain-containing protein n=1 Tax=Nitratidesulfovibrio sp. HK-II TaxID=2009266 RepID=UPI000E2EE8C3|nr:EAL domain-containing protein [Nitratidesulfovibrio sp. HK-II]GBO96098.1 diguanylate cyclase [Nitratidesulfovibrio sp. HK-II]
MKRSRLFGRTLRGLIVLFGVYAAVTSVYSGWTLHTLLTREYESKALAIARAIAGADLESLIGRDVTTVQSRIDQFLGIDGVSYVLVADGRGETLAHTFVPVVPEPVRQLAASLAGARMHEVTVLRDRLRIDDPAGKAGREVMHVTMPVFSGVGGFVHIGMDRGRISEYIDGAILRQQGLGLAFFAACAVGAWVLLHSISRPLMHLTEQARRVAAHDFSAPPELPAAKADDEIGDLSRAMDTMSRDLAGLVEGLEDSVRQATAELGGALEQLSTIVAGMADGLLVTDPQGLVLRSNAALCAMFGLDADPDGKPVGEVFGFVAPDAPPPGVAIHEFAFETEDGEDIAPEPEVHDNAALLAFLAGADVPGDPMPGVSCTLPGPVAAPPCGTGDGGAGVGAALRSGEVAAVRRDGTPCWVELSLVRRQVMGTTYGICLVRDVTERRRAQDALHRAHGLLERKVRERTRELSRANAQLMLENAERRTVEQALRRAEARFRGIFEHALEGIFQSTPEGRFLSVNPAMARILGYDDEQELLGVVESIGTAVYVDPARRAEFVERMEELGQVTGFEFRARRKGGEYVWLSVNARRVPGADGATMYYEGFLEDVTLGHESRERLEHQAFHDPLTALPNRLLFHDRLQMALKRAARRRNYTFAMLYLDLDRFKVINDSLGHDVGDALLKVVAEKLRECVRDVDTVARFGGDEFGVLLEETPSRGTAVRVARRIRARLAEPVRIGPHEVFTTASIGIVLRTDQYSTPEELVRDADTAMYRAKEQGQSRFKVFNKRMREEALRLLTIETDLRRAVERQEMRLHYQPVVSLEDGGLHGVEALLRWTRTEGGDISPAEFVPVAEDTGLITSIGAFALEEVCAQLRRWSDAGLPPPGVVHVNISGRQFMQPGLPHAVETLLDRTGTDPRTLRFEVTESVLMRHGSQAITVMGQLRELGIRLCLDDFGTGYSSLGYLKRLPVDSIKIDRSFVAGLEHDRDGQAIVRSILSLGLHLGLEIVAEGVETHTQADILASLGCRYAQGFLYAPPLAAGDLVGMLGAAPFPPAGGGVFAGGSL